jgi:DNA-binding CsgD family transcriptional regulator/tetratricopeptide (TPR) repeat protein
LRGAEDVEWLERLEREHDNLRAALSWALERGEVELALRLAGALWKFWEVHGHYGEGRKWLKEALAKDGHSSVAARAKALEGVCWMAMDWRELDRAEAAAQAGLKLDDEAEIGNKFAASFRTMLGYAVTHRGDHEQAKELYEESLRLSREADDKVGIADALLFLADAWYGLGDRTRAKKLWEEGIILCREVGYMYRLPYFSGSLGYVSMLEGDYERGAALTEEAATLYRERGYKAGFQYILDNLGWVALLRGHHERAKAAYEESLVVCKELGDPMIASESLEGLACVAGTRGEAEQAARLFGAAEALREAVGYQWHTPEEDALREPYLAAARSQLDEATWEAAWAQGKTMGLEEVIEWALSVEEPSTATLSSSRSEHPAGLTSREIEVLGLVAAGMTSAQIAKELFLSPRTVEAHLASIYHKLGVTSRAGATRFALEHDLA